MSTLDFFLYIIIAVAGAVFGPMIQRRIDPRARREKEVRAKAKEAVTPYVQQQHFSGPVRDVHIYQFQNFTTANNANYVTTGEGVPQIPRPEDVFPSAGTSTKIVDTPFKTSSLD